MSEYISNHLGGNCRPQQTHSSCMTKSMRSVFPLNIGLFPVVGRGRVRPQPP